MRQSESLMLYSVVIYKEKPLEYWGFPSNRIPMICEKHPQLTLSGIFSRTAHRSVHTILSDNAKPILPEVEMAENSYDLAKGTDAIILVTEWNEFKNLDLEHIKELMKQPVLIDGRNVYDPVAVRNLGFHYLGIGRGYDGEGLG